MKFLVDAQLPARLSTNLDEIESALAEAHFVELASDRLIVHRSN